MATCFLVILNILHTFPAQGECPKPIRNSLYKLGDCHTSQKYSGSVPKKPTIFIGSRTIKKKAATCLSPQCSTDLTMTGVRPPKFLDGNAPTGTIPRASLNAGAVARVTLFQTFPHATPRCRPDLSTCRPDPRTHWNPTI